MRLCLCYLLLSTCLLMYGQESRTFSKAQLEADLHVLLHQLEVEHEAHEHSFYTSHFRKQGDSLRAQLYEGMEEQDFFRLLSRFLAQSDERHLRLGYAKWDPLQGNALGWRHKQGQLFPFELKYVQGEAYIWENYSGQLSIPRGARLLTINGQQMDAITAELLPYVISDGHILRSKYHDLSRRFRQYFSLYMQPAAHYHLLYVHPQTGKRVSCTVNGLSENQIKERKARRYASWQQAEGPESVYTFSLSPDGNMAILQLKTFDLARYRKHRLQVRQLYQQLFARMRQQGIGHLILDLRGNPGGNFSAMFELLSYLIHEPRQGAIKYSVSYKGRENAYGFPHPQPLAFRGQLYLLIDGTTFSAASELAAYLQNYTPAILIGEESAGCYEGYAAGYTRQFRLPHTGIRVWLPRVSYEFAVPPAQEKGRGVMPHHEVLPTIEDLLAGRDPALSHALKLAAAEMAEAGQASGGN